MKILLSLVLVCGFTLSLKAQDFTDKIIKDVNILFENGKSDIQTLYFPILDSISNIVKKDTMLQASITAHTDNNGSNAHNEKLSQSRAYAIKNQLLQRGVIENRLKTAWKGEIEPIFDNFTEGGKAQNRRVIVTIFRRIYTAKVTSVVKNDSGAVVPNAIVTMRSKYLADTTRTDSSGVFSITIPYKQVAFVEVTAQAHFYDKKILNLGVFKANIKDFIIAKAEIGKKMKIKDLNFYGSEDRLIPESEPNLKILLLFMRINPTYKIELAGHVNESSFIALVGSYEYNLSVARATTVYNYLIKNGVAKERMITKGYANWEMLFQKPDSEEQMSANRRVEVRILEK
jgi:outer membrane protein OmpA-like peptidoglycan-associated protein